MLSFEKQYGLLDSVCDFGFQYRHVRYCVELRQYPHLTCRRSVAGHLSSRPKMVESLAYQRKEIIRLGIEPSVAPASCARSRGSEKRRARPDSDEMQNTCQELTPFGDTYLPHKIGVKAKSSGFSCAATACLALMMLFSQRALSHETSS